MISETEDVAKPNSYVNIYVNMPRRSVKGEGGSFQFLVALPEEYVRQLDVLASETSAPRVALVRSAIETFLAERGGDRLSVDLPDDLRVNLAALQDALDGASVQRMIGRALRQYIDKFLSENEGIRARFAEAVRQIAIAGSSSRGRVVEFRRTRMS